MLSDLLTAKLGVGWEARGRRHSAKPRYEITGVAESLMAEFSRRSEQIAEHSELLRAEFKAAHGRSAPPLSVLSTLTPSSSVGRLSKSST